jgi:NAD-dependent deacetylase
MTDLIERAAQGLSSAKYAIALTGAGMSTESGILDFRGPKGLWTTNPQAEAKAYERYRLFVADPAAYWREMVGGQGGHGGFYDDARTAEPNAGHIALAQLERLGVLKCVITQNIDGLHPKAGSGNVIEYHGSVHKARCPSCGSRSWLEDVLLSAPPPTCSCGGALKLDFVHFGEPIPPHVMVKAEEEAFKCDLMIVCGTSAVVYPFAGLPRSAKMRPGPIATVIEVNAERTPLTDDAISDCLIQGRTGEILPRIVEALTKETRVDETSEGDPPLR